MLALCEKWKASVNKTEKILENTRRPTLCWQCGNAEKGEKSPCSWAREFRPVDGWTARQTKVYVAQSGDRGGRGKYDDSFCVDKCTLFVVQ